MDDRAQDVDLQSSGFGHPKFAAVLHDFVPSQNSLALVIRAWQTGIVKISGQLRKMIYDVAAAKINFRCLRPIISVPLFTGDDRLAAFENSRPNLPTLSVAVTDNPNAGAAKFIDSVFNLLQHQKSR
mgnify:CR=1 FL=1